MTKLEIIKTIKELGKSQGFYSGLSSFLNEKSKKSKEFLDYLESKKFKDPIELISYFEE